MTAQRNVLASDLVNAFHAAGVALRSEPIKHEMYTVLAKTDAVSYTHLDVYKRQI